MRLTAWYHLWAGGAWQEPLHEFRTALRTSGFIGRTFYGIVGTEAECAAVYEACPFFVKGGQSLDGTNEYATLNALRTYAAGDDGAVLYAHTKGASENTEFRARWRRSMTTRVVARWRETLALLETGEHDAVGCHWLTEDAFPGMFGPMTVPAEGSGFFGGNFWMARCDYLRTLPVCPAEPRWEAERWIGLNGPRVVDLLPGWPHDNRWPELCG